MKSENFETLAPLPRSKASSEHSLPQKLSLGQKKTLRGSSDETEAGLPTNQSGFFRKSKNPPSSHGYRERTEARRFPCKVYYYQHGHEAAGSYYQHGHEAAGSYLRGFHLCKLCGGAR